MANYPQHLKLLLLVWSAQLALGLAQEESPELLQRSKRTLTTICVEIKPSGPQEEPYFMCKGTDFSRGGPTQEPPKPPAEPQPPQTPFPSFPSFGAGYYPIASTNQAPAAEPLLPHYGAAPAASPPGPAAQPYGLSTVSYPTPAGPAPAAHGAPAGSGAASAPPAYADAAAPKSPPAGPGAAPAKPQPANGQAGYGNAYEALMGSRHQSGLGVDVVEVPAVGFRPDEFNMPYRRPLAGSEPLVGAAPQMVWLPLMQTQLQQPTVAAVAPQHPYYDDPIMRTFYSSLEQNEPQVAQATPVQQAAPSEQPVGQTVPGYGIGYGQPAPAPAAAAAPAPAPAYATVKASPAPPLEGNPCNSCTRACPTPLDAPVYQAPAHCPSFQPVIIAMPCYGQQQPTHYVAVPNSVGTAAPRDSMLGSSFAGPFGLGTPFQQVGSPFNQVGSAFGLAPQPGPAYGLPAPQVGSTFGMGTQVGAPFGMGPALNPFGPFGSLNPFNPFNRILGAAAPTTQLPRLRLFGAPEESTTPMAITSAASSSSTLNFSSSTPAPVTKASSETTDAVVGVTQGKKADPDEQEEKEEEEEDNSEEKSKGSEFDKLEEELAGKDLSADELITKGEEKLKPDNKRKRQNSRGGNSSSQRRKYLQRL